MILCCDVKRSSKNNGEKQKSAIERNTNSEKQKPAIEWNAIKIMIICNSDGKLKKNSANVLLDVCSYLAVGEESIADGKYLICGFTNGMIQLLNPSSFQTLTTFSQSKVNLNEIILLTNINCNIFCRY